MDASFWIALVSLLVAITGTGVNARAVRREQADRKAQIEAEWAREWAAQRPVVYPIALADWAYGRGAYGGANSRSRLLPLKNGGRGPALNVRGTVTASSPDGTTYEREILAGAIAAADLLDARLVPHPGVEHWTLRVEGAVRYSDLVGTDWETRFETSKGPGNEIVVTAHEPSVVSGKDLSA